MLSRTIIDCGRIPHQYRLEISFHFDSCDSTDDIRRRKFAKLPRLRGPLHVMAAVHSNGTVTIDRRHMRIGRTFGVGAGNVPPPVPLRLHGHRHESREHTRSRETVPNPT